MKSFSETFKCMMDPVFDEIARKLEEEIPESAGFGKFPTTADPGPWPFPKSPPETNENFDDILEWSPEEEDELLKILDGEEDDGNTEVS
jgi:hypothetical protein